jgi:large subunit ribosomal protein L21
MYAVLATGGKQFKVQEGQSFRIEKIEGEVGSSVSFDKVLLYSDGQTVSIGKPYLDHIKVEGHIIQQGKARKVVVFKYKRRNRYRRKQGHRQEFTSIQVDHIRA